MRDKKPGKSATWSMEIPKKKESVEAMELEYIRMYSMAFELRS